MAFSFSRFLDVLIDYENRYGETYIPRDRLGFGSSRDEDEDQSDIVIDEEASTTWTTSRRHSHSHGGCGSSVRRTASCSDDEYEEEENHQRMVDDAVTCARLGHIMRVVDRGMDIAARRR